MAVARSKRCAPVIWFRPWMMARKEVRWIGTRTISGARLKTFPALRPVSIKTDAFGASHPQPDLLLSPQHRVLVRGAEARNLFNTPEVLVAATDLLNDNSIRRISPANGVTYIHLMFDRHQVVWANGILSETFHPASADLGAMESAERDDLLSLCPEACEWRIRLWRHRAAFAECC